MKKEERNYNEEFKKLNILMYVAIAILVVICLLNFITIFTQNSNKAKYDVSMMREVGIEETLELFNSNDTYVLYIGRETCDVCHDLLPSLQEVQKNNNFITQYMDLTKVDRSSSNWKRLVELLNVETTTTMSESGGTDLVTDTFGNFVDSKGFTPCVLVISNGKQVSGFFGSKSSQELDDWLANYGI